jgi:RNA polymerase-binding transcription factor DksA
MATTATARSLSSSIKDIDTALTRIDEGTYGTCEHCGKAIPEARLQALPATSRCVDCAAL